MEPYWELLGKSLTHHLKKVHLDHPTTSKNDLIVSYGVFNTELSIFQVKPNFSSLNDQFKKVKPDGLTALYDAIGLSIVYLQKNASKQIEDIPITVIFIILTDGNDNASKRCQAAQIGNHIKRLQKEKWDFIFMGVDLDCREINTNLNIPNFKYYNFNKAEFKLTFDRLTEIVIKNIKLGIN